MTDVLSKRITAAGAISTGRGRVVAISAVGAAGAGRITLTDGSGGATLLDVDVPLGTGQTLALYIGEQGVLFKTSIFASVVTATGVTIFYAS
jgi:hypothetical protein